VSLFGTNKNNVPFSDRLIKMSLLVTITGKYDTINKRTGSTKNKNKNRK
jgi:hypothetical protein